MSKKMQLAAVFIVLSFNFSVLASDKFPKMPDAHLTPGELCQRPDAYRYPERIAYCERNVDSKTKRKVMNTYDKELGYQTTKMPRNKFKIDHFIPLCMGGSNSEQNLWPQHESIYQQTDELEFVLCQKMSQGDLKQSDAVDLIKRAKFEVKMVEELLQEYRY